MKNRLWIVAAVTVLSLAGTTVALAATGKKATKKAAATTTSTTTRAPETPLTGDAATQAKAAALAAAGTGHRRRGDDRDRQHGRRRRLRGPRDQGRRHARHADPRLELQRPADDDRRPAGGPGPGGPHGGPGNGETPLTGDVATKAKAAAVAKVGTGSTADFASTETDSTLAGAAYEVHVTKSDGTHVEVILDKDDAVLAVETAPGGGPWFVARASGTAAGTAHVEDRKRPAARPPSSSSGAGASRRSR